MASVVPTYLSDGSALVRLRDDGIRSEGNALRRQDTPLPPEYDFVVKVPLPYAAVQFIYAAEASSHHFTLRGRRSEVERWLHEARRGVDQALRKVSST